jgi:hypothetical protein
MIGVQQRKDGDFLSFFNYFCIHLIKHLAKDSLFAFKYRRLNSAVSGDVEEHEELDVQTAFPIFGEFNIAISQMKRQTVDMRSRGASASSGSGGFLYTIQHAVYRTSSSDHIECHPC